MGLGELTPNRKLYIANMTPALSLVAHVQALKAECKGDRRRRKQVMEKVGHLERELAERHRQESAREGLPGCMASLGVSEVGGGEGMMVGGEVNGSGKSRAQRRKVSMRCEGVKKVCV